MSAFRRSAAQETKNTGGKGGKSAWFEKMRLPKSDPAPIILLRGSYLDPNPPQDLQEIDPRTGMPKPVYNDYFKYKKHVRKFMDNGKEQYRDEPCSAGTDAHNPQPCAGCAAGDSGDKSIRLSDAYVFGIVHLALYHAHPLVDWKTNQIKMKQDNTPIMTFAECEGRLCNYCKVSKGEQPVVPPGTQWAGWGPQHISTSFGHRRYLELGKGHLSNLSGFDMIVSGVCGTCKNQFSVEGYGCETCNSMLIDMTTETRSDEQIQEAVSKLYPCMTCNRGVLPKEAVCCEACEAAGRQWRQDTLFNSILYLFRQGEGKSSQVMMQRHQSLEEFGQYATQQGWLGGKTIYQFLEEIGKPYDFMEMFKPRSMDEQRKKMGFGGQQQQGGPQYGAYGQQPQYQQPPQQQQYQQPGQYQQPQYPQQQQMPMPGQYPQQPPQQQQQFMAPPPQQPQYASYPPAQGYVPPGPNTAGQPGNGVGPAPFQPVGRPNFGS